jgi:hypothetical protein
MYAPIFCADYTLAGSRVGFNRNPTMFRGFARMNRTGPLAAKQACRARYSSARLRISPPLCGRAAGENSSQPGGLRAGSPPSPPPRLIRPTVRRLLRSPRLSGPGPHWIGRLVILPRPVLPSPSRQWSETRTGIPDVSASDTAPRARSRGACRRSHGARSAGGGPGRRCPGSV